MKRALVQKIMRSVVVVIFTAQVLCSQAFAVDSDMAPRANLFFPNTRPEVQVRDVIIPTRLGFVDGEHTGSSDKTVFLIKDAHCNYGAQKTIASLIDWIVSRYGVHLVNLEGGRGSYDFRALDKISDVELKRSVLETYLEKGKISGPEFYRILNRDNVTLAGIEDTYLYEENLASYHNVLLYKAQVDRFLGKMLGILNEERGNVFSEQLKLFDEKQESYASKELDITSYIIYLSRMASIKGIDITDYPNILKMAKLFLIEGDIDFKKANDEKEVVVRELTGRLSRYESFELLQEVARFTSGQISEAMFYSFLAEKAKATGISRQDSPDFFKYAEYAELYSGVDKAGLFDELKLLETSIEAGLIVSAQERTISGHIKQVRLLQKALSLQLDRYSLNTLKKNIDIEALLAFARNKVDGADYKDLEEGAVYASHCYSSIMVFYYLADKRDEAFLRNIDDNMFEEDTETSIVVTGGFHYDNLAKLLREKGISYISINPSFHNDPGYINPYLNILAGKEDDFSTGVVNALTSTIQVKSDWSEMGIETEFISSLLSRLELLVALEKKAGTSEVLFEVGDRKLFFSKRSNYTPNLLYPQTYKLRDKCKVINWTEFMDVSPLVMQKKLDEFFSTENRDTRLRFLDEFSGKGDLGRDLAEILKRKSLESVPGKQFAPKKALLRPNGHIVEREVRGMKNIDTYVYVFDLETGVLTCQSSETMTGAESGYMVKPQVEGNEDKPSGEKNEKWYLCNKLMKIFNPENTIEQQKVELSKLLYEQHEYESRLGKDGKYSCGWEWDIDHDEEGRIYIDPEKFLGLRALRIYDRTKLPEDILPRKMDRDAMIYGGVENVQEMKFSIIPAGNKIRIELITSWAASEKEQVLEKAANISVVSGLPNRRYFSLVALPSLIGKAKDALPVSVLFIDGDNFKHYNDDYNHAVGDEVIRAISEAINKSVRGSDIVINWGGDEFVVLLPSALATNAKAVANNILEQIKRIDFNKVLETAGYIGAVKPGDENLSATIGVAMASTLSEVERLKETITEADEMLKYAKRGQKGTVLVLGEYDEFEEFDREQGFREVQIDRMPIDLRLALEEYLPAFQSNLRTFIERDYIKGMPQGEILKNIYEDFKSDRALKRIMKRLEIRRTEFQMNKDNDKQIDEIIAQKVREDMRKLYYKILVYKMNVNEAIGDRAASRNVSTAVASIGDAAYLTYRYVIRDWEEISKEASETRDWRDTSENTIKLPSFSRVIADIDPGDIPKEEAIFAGKFDGVTDFLRVALSLIKTMFESEVINGFDEEILENDVFSSYSRELNGSYASAALVSEKSAFELKKALEEYKRWLTELSLGFCRFPKEKRVVMYPVYGESSFAQESKMAFAIRKGLAKSEYAFNIMPIPYLAGKEESYENALENLREIIETDKLARGMVYASGELYDNDVFRAKGEFGEKVIYVKEEGYDSTMDEFTYMGLGIRSALSFAVMDYFDPRNDLKEVHREKLKDMIAAILGMITRDDNIMAIFKDNPDALIDGLIVIKPAERVAWDEVVDKVDAEKQFVYSL